MTTHVTRAGLAGLMLATSALTGCGGLRLYEVTLTPSVRCEITPMGDRCRDPEPLPLTETFALEQTEGRTAVHAGSRTFWAEGTSETLRAHRVVKETRLPGPCTTTTTEVLEFTADGAQLTGTLKRTVEIGGPPACGETPRGERFEYTVAGPRTNQL